MTIIKHQSTNLPKEVHNTNLQNEAHNNKVRNEAHGRAWYQVRPGTKWSKNLQKYHKTNILSNMNSEMFGSALKPRDLKHVYSETVRLLNTLIQVECMNPFAHFVMTTHIVMFSLFDTHLKCTDLMVRNLPNLRTTMAALLRRQFPFMRLTNVQVQEMSRSAPRETYWQHENYFCKRIPVAERDEVLNWHALNEIMVHMVLHSHRARSRNGNWSIVKLKGFYICPRSGETVLVFPHVKGKTLRKCLGQQSMDRRRICRNLVEALQFLHREQVAHLDLKPDNIMVSPDNKQVHIIDLGSSHAPPIKHMGWGFETKCPKTDLRINSSFVRTTYHYGAPEVFNLNVLFLLSEQNDYSHRLWGDCQHSLDLNPDGLYDPFRADLFSLGMILMEVYLGKNTFQETIDQFEGPQVTRTSGKAGAEEDPLSFHYYCSRALNIEQWVSHVESSLNSGNKIPAAIRRLLSADPRKRGLNLRSLLEIKF